MAPGRTTRSANMNVAMGSTLSTSESNESRKISSDVSSYQVAGTQIEVPKTVSEKTASYAVTGAPAKAPATEELEEYIDAAENNFEIDLDYTLGQQVTELSDLDGKSPSSTHGSGVSGLYTATPASRQAG